MTNISTAGTLTSAMTSATSDSDDDDDNDNDNASTGKAHLSSP